MTQHNGRIRRVLFVQATGDLHEATHALLGVVRHAIARGLDCTVALPGDGPAAGRFEYTGAQVMALPRVATITNNPVHGFGPSSSGLSAEHSVRALARTIRSDAIDLVYSNTSAVVAGALAARETRCRHVWHVRERFDSLGPFARVYSRFVAASSCRVLCDSIATAAQFVSKEKVHVVPEEPPEGNGTGAESPRARLAGPTHSRAVVEQLMHAADSRPPSSSSAFRTGGNRSTPSS